MCSSWFTHFIALTNILFSTSKTKSKGRSRCVPSTHLHSALTESVYQIFYLADMGRSEADLAKSVFVEKLIARGYEVLLLGQPLDEVFVQNLKRWKYVSCSQFSCRLLIA